MQADHLHSSSAVAAKECTPKWGEAPHDGLGLEADMAMGLFDHLVEQCRRHSKAERLGGLKVDDRARMWLSAGTSRASSHRKT